jgi:hypothetical protein
VLVRGALLVLGLAACSRPATSDGPDRAGAVGNQPARPQEGTVIEVMDAAGIAQHDGKVVTLVGHYRVVSTGRHQIMHTLPDGSTVASSAVVRLVLSDRTNVDLWVRPDEEMDELEDKVVRATGRLLASPTRTGPGAQPDPSPSLLDIQTIVAN